ncbi:MAG: hypothetical protein Q9214_001577 [Letrouitia sp. 1 TL-2023]
MLSTQTAQKAIKIRGPGSVELTHSSEIPQPKDDEVLVRVVCVAINPVDGKSADLSPTLGATVGCDFSGQLVTIGSSVKQNLTTGDAVCGCVFGNNPDELNNGAFAEYVAIPGDLVFRIPSEMSYSTAATLGVGMATVGMALYRTLKLPLPGSRPEEPDFVLVYGGGTATGTLAIQMLYLQVFPVSIDHIPPPKRADTSWICRSGLKPIATCSPRNFGRLKSLGAVETFDYCSPSCGREIQEYTKDSLKYAMDCITETESMKICYTAIGTKGGQYVALDPFPIRTHTRRSVKPNWIIAFTTLNKPINWARPFRREAKPKDRDFGEGWVRLVQTLLDNGAITPHPHEKRAGGLAGVIDGMDQVRKGVVLGSKLVYEIASAL